MANKPAPAPVPRRGRRQGIGKRSTPRGRGRSRRSMGNVNAMGIVAMIGGAVVSKMIDPMLKGVIKDDTMRAAAKAAGGILLAVRGGGIVSNLAIGVAIESGASLADSIFKKDNLTRFQGMNDPVLIGYTVDELADEFGANIPALIGEEDDDLGEDEFGEDDDLGEDEFGEDDNLGYDVDELQGLY